LNYQWTVGLVFWSPSTPTCQHKWLQSCSISLPLNRFQNPCCMSLFASTSKNIYIYIKVWIVYIYLTPSCLLQTQFFFNGDRVEGTKNPVGERLSGLQKIAEILVVVLMLMTLRHLFSMAVFLSIKTLFHLWMDTGSQNRIAQLYNLVRLCWYFGKL
jgi:hypothetical protein